jgi:enoyl-CoA hydratase
MPHHQVVTVERTGAIATLWLDRPEARNAMGPAFWAQLPAAMAELGSDDEVRAVVIAARGPHFSVGLDLKAMGALLTEGGSGAPAGGGPKPSPAKRAMAARASVQRMQAAITAVAECPTPVIAAVHGYCVGGGVDLISACDLRLASADAIFSVRETRMAIVADLGSLQRLPGIIGRGQLAELAYTGRDIGADRALAIGLVNDVLPDEDGVQGAARALAEEIAANPPLVVRGVKAVLAAGEGRSVREGLDYVATWNAGFLPSDDLTEAVTAFVEKREPTFRGN